MLLKNKKKVDAKVVQKEVERELSEESLGQVAGGCIVPTGNPEFDRRQSESFNNLPHMNIQRILKHSAGVSSSFGNDEIKLG